MSNGMGCGFACAAEASWCIRDLIFAWMFAVFAPPPPCHWLWKPTNDLDSIAGFVEKIADKTRGQIWLIFNKYMRDQVKSKQE